MRPGCRALRRFRRHRLALPGSRRSWVLTPFSAAGPWLLPYDDLHIDILHRFAAPFVGPHLLGTDQLGRDMLARLMMAGRVSLTVGFAAMGCRPRRGAWSAWSRAITAGLAGTALMRLVDAMLCFPSIFLLLTLAALVQPGLVTITLIIAPDGVDGGRARRRGAGARRCASRDFAVAA